MHDTDNFAYIIEERRKRYEAYAQWDKEAAETHRKVGNWLLCFVLFGISIMLIKSIHFLIVG